MDKTECVLSKKLLAAALRVRLPLRGSCLENVGECKKSGMDLVGYHREGKLLILLSPILSRNQFLHRLSQMIRPISELECPRSGLFTSISHLQDIHL